MQVLGLQTRQAGLLFQIGGGLGVQILVAAGAAKRQGDGRGGRLGRRSGADARLEVVRRFRCGFVLGHRPLPASDGIRTA